MEPFIRLAHHAGGIILSWLPVFCYAGGAAFLIGGGLMLWHSQRAGSPYQGRLGLISGVFLCGFLLLGFIGLLNASSATIGAPGRASMGAAMTSYDAVGPDGFLGMGPMETLLAIIDAFLIFFQAVGAAFICHAIYGLKGVYTATVRHRYGPPLAEGAAGVFVMNLDHVVAALARSVGAAV